MSQPTHPEIVGRALSERGRANFDAIDWSRKPRPAARRRIDRPAAEFPRSLPIVLPRRAQAARSVAVSPVE